jgi:flagellar hook-length control protein FliK
MADSITILKNSSKNSVAGPSPVNRQDKTASGYFQKNLINSIDDFKAKDSDNTSNQLPADFADSLQNNQIASALQGINNVVSNSFNSYEPAQSQAPSNDSYHSAALPSDDESNVVKYDTPKKESPVDNSISDKNQSDLSANSNQKLNSIQKEVQENPKTTAQKSEQTAQAVVSKDGKTITTDTAKSVAKELAANVIVSKLTSAKTSTVVQPDTILVSLNNKTTKATPANVLQINTNPVKEPVKLQEDIVKAQQLNIKNAPDYLSAAKNDVKQTTVQAGQLNQVIKNDITQDSKDLSKMFIKQNENAEKTELSVNNQNIKIEPKTTMQAQNQNVQPDLAKNVANNVNSNVANNAGQQVKNDVPLISSDKFQSNNNNQGNNNSQSNAEDNSGNLANNLYSTAMATGKELDLTNSVGLTSVRIEDIAEKTLQIVKNLQNNTTTTARLLLKPPSLGTVFVEITMKDNVAQLTLRADTKEAVKGLESQLAILKDNLSQQGIKTQSIKIEVRQVENDLTDHRASSEGSNARQREKGSNNREFIHSFASLNELRDETANSCEEGIDQTILTQNIV